MFFTITKPQLALKCEVWKQKRHLSTCFHFKYQRSKHNDLVFCRKGYFEVPQIHREKSTTVLATKYVFCKNFLKFFKIVTPENVFEKSWSVNQYTQFQIKN